MRLGRIGRDDDAERPPRAPDPPPAGPAWGFLAADRLFADLDLVERQAIESRIPAVTFGAGRVVHEAGQAGEILFWLIRGRLRIVRPVGGGRSAAEATIEPGAIFGDLVLAGQRLSGVRIEAIEEAELRVFRRAEWEDALRQRPAVAIRLIEILGQRLIQPAAREAADPSADLAARVAAQLLRQVDRHTGDLVEVHPAKLAERLGGDPAAIGRILDQFLQARYLDRVGHRGRLRDPAALRRLADR